MNELTRALVASGILSVASLPVLAAEPVSVYGKVNVAIQTNDTQGDLNTEIKNINSRLGFKGSVDLMDNLETFYKIEYAVNTSGEDGARTFTARNQYVGLAGEFGSVAIGRRDTVLKDSQGIVDPFDDLPGDIENFFTGDQRIAQTATYYTPTYNNFRLGITYVPESSIEQKNAAGANNDADDGMSVAAIYGDTGFNNVPVYAAVAYNSKVAGKDVLWVTLQGKVGDFLLGGMYQNQENNASGSKRYDGYLLSAIYHYENMKFKVQYVTADGGFSLQKFGGNSIATQDGESISVGFDYSLGESTNVYAYYGNYSLDELADDSSAWGLGFSHNF